MGRGIPLVATLCLLASSQGCGLAEGDPYPAFGFEAHFDPSWGRPATDARCGMDGPTSWNWIWGPHGGFDDLRPRTLAAESLDWFQHSVQASAWRSNPTARLEFVYPSGPTVVTARFDSEVALTWEAQIRAWFERFPPSDRSRPELASEGFHWHVDFGTRGQVRGDADSDSEAIESMRSTAGVRGPLFESPTFTLGYSVRRTPHTMDCYSVEVEVQDRIQELPRLLAAKREQHGGG